MTRVCLISPRHLSANPRLVKACGALAGAGYSVQVICGQYAAALARHDRAIAEPNWQVRYVPFGRSQASLPLYLLQTARRHTARMLVRSGSRRPALIELAHAPSVPELVTAARAAPADLYIAHYAAALPAAAQAARNFGAAYAYDAEDFHVGELPDEPGYSIEKEIIRSIEGKYLPGASFVTAASPMIARAYEDSYGISAPTVVLNTFLRSSSPASPSSEGWASPGPSLYWFSQTIGPGRGLEAAVEAIANAGSRPHLYLRGDPAAGYDRSLRSLAAQLGVAERVHFLPRCSPAELEKLGAQYDVGYSGEPGFSRNNTFALGNKIFSYLCSGLPVLASDVPSHREIAPDLQGAMTLFSADDSSSLAAALDHLLLSPTRLGAARERAWQLAQQRFCWELEQEILLSAVRKALPLGRDLAPASPSPVGA